MFTYDVCNISVFNVLEEIFQIRNLMWGPPWVFCLVVRIANCYFQNNFGAALFLVESEVKLFLYWDCIIFFQVIICLFTFLDWNFRVNMLKNNYLCSLQLEIKKKPIFRTRLCYG